MIHDLQDLIHNGLKNEVALTLRFADLNSPTDQSVVWPLVEMPVFFLKIWVMVAVPFINGVSD